MRAGFAILAKNTFGGLAMHKGFISSYTSAAAAARLALATGALALLHGCGQPTPPVDEEGWQLLLDGQSLDFWTVVGDANWRLEEGSAIADQSTANSWLVSTGRYANFELDLEFWVNTEANSGVFLRCQSAETIDESSCYEVNIYDTRPDQTYRTGGIVNLAEPAQFVYTGGQWNRFSIKAEGAHLQVTLNGKEMIDLEDSKLAEGHVALQYGTGTVRFRNVRLKPL
jgi:hypothetical protein